MSSALKHTHKYYKLSDRLWHCAECSHYMPSNLPIESMYGRKSICWDCGKEFKLTEDLMKDLRPKCYECAHPEFAALTEYIAKKEMEARLAKLTPPTSRTVDEITKDEPSLDKPLFGDE